MSGSRFRSILDIGSTLVVTGAAVIMVVGFLADRSAGRSTSSGPVFIETWREDSEQGIWLGRRDAPIVITEFMDFQCPFCRRLVPVVDSALKVFPNDVAVAFQHFPLRNHPYAMGAAVAAECAERQDRFASMYRALFRSQESLGTRSWQAFAEESEVPDLAEFRRCTSLPPDSFPRIAAGRQLGERTGVRGTPTVWVNGNVGTVTFERIKDLVERNGSGRGEIRP